jgi:GMP synthase (glutamine-hydrolysing)
VLCTTEKEKSKHHKNVTAICKEYGLRGCILPLQSVGVQGDSRSYTDVAIIAGEADLGILQKVSTAITNTCIDVNRVAYCLDSTVDLKALYVHKASLVKKRVDLLREADIIAHQILENADSSNDVWQFPVILIPVSRTDSSRESVVLRPVRSIDGMTAEFAKLPISILRRMAKKIRKLDQIDLVFFDVSNKPPATIEWE